MLLYFHGIKVEQIRMAVHSYRGGSIFAMSSSRGTGVCSVLAVSRCFLYPHAQT